MDLPAADIEIDRELVARLIDAQHPDLAGRLTLVANGWDNAIYRLGDDLCVRLPRRQIAVQLIVNEQRWLPVLAERLGVPIPVAVRIGEPTSDYPWPWTISRWFEGQLAADVTAADRGAAASELAEFLTRLHAPAPADAPHNPVRGVPLTDGIEAINERLSSGMIPRGKQLRELWDTLAATPAWTGPPLWVHGDLHPANILLTHGQPGSNGHLRAVLDFGDLTAGDPACDLAAAWMVFDEEARSVFRAHIDRVSGTDQNTWARARGWALRVGSAIAVYSDDSPRMAAIARHALDQVLLEQ